MSELPQGWRDVLIGYIENSHRYGIDQLSFEIFNTLYLADWSLESIELLGDGLRSVASHERMRLDMVKPNRGNPVSCRDCNRQVLPSDDFYGIQQCSLCHQEEINQMLQDYPEGGDVDG